MIMFLLHIEWRKELGDVQNNQLNKAIKKQPSTMRTIMNRIKEKTNIPIDWNNINRVSIKAMRLDRKNLNIGNTPWTTYIFQLIKFAKNKVMSN